MEAERVDEVKARLSRLRSHDVELVGVIERAVQEYEAEVKPVAAAIERAWIERKAVIEKATAEHEAAVERATKEHGGQHPPTAEYTETIARERALCQAAIERAWAEHNAVAERANAECEEGVGLKRVKRDAAMERARAERNAVRAEIVLVERELNVLVNAPVSGGRDPTDWLPDELVLLIILFLPGNVLWAEVCERVCQRWARLMESARVKRRKRDGRWAA
jgi:hypothetical protein